MKNKTIIKIAIALIFLVLVVLTIMYSNLLSISGTKEFKYKGFNVVANSNTDFTGQSQNGGCGNWGAIVSPLEDTNSSITLQSYSNSGSCTANGGSSSLSLTIPNPKQYKQIFIQLSGSLDNGGYSGTSNCPSANMDISLEHDTSTSLSSASVGCVNSQYTFPAGILLKIEDNFLVIPSISSTIPLSDNNLIISLSSSASSNANGRSAKSILTLQDIQTTLKDIPQPPICTQEAGQLCNPTTKQILSYANGCDKNDLLLQGYQADLSKCDTIIPCPTYDIQCDGEIIQQGFDENGCNKVPICKENNTMIYIISGLVAFIGGGIFVFRKQIKRGFT